MALSENLRELVSLCERGATLEAISRFYADDVVVFENHERARAGREACLAYESAALAALKEPAKLRAKAYAADAQSGVAFIEWVIRFLGEDGRPMRLDEVSVQRWAGGRIVEERFYYEGMVDEGDEDEDPSAPP
jgi:ketosteroid isomerase-like protein